MARPTKNAEGRLSEGIQVRAVDAHKIACMNSDGVIAVPLQALCEASPGLTTSKRAATASVGETNIENFGTRQQEAARAETVQGEDRVERAGDKRATVCLHVELSASELKEIEASGSKGLLIADYGSSVTPAPQA